MHYKWKKDRRESNYVLLRGCLLVYKASVLIIDDDRGWCDELRGYLEGYLLFDMLEFVHIENKSIVSSW